MEPPQWKKVPICEVCHHEPATSFSWFNKADEWKYCGDCGKETETYYISFTRFFRSPAATVDWLAHLSEKNWFKPADFLKMLHRFRAATESFGQT